jgi:L-fuculose-phosphate aldolase
MKAEKTFKKDRKVVAKFMNRLYRQGLTTTSGGNISLRLSDDIIAITPSGTDKGRMKWRQVGLVTLTGENLTGHLKLSMEYEMHLSVYRNHTDVNSVVHAHPLFASSFTAMKCRIHTDLTAEAWAVIGEPVPVPYALVGSKELAESVAGKLSSGPVLLLENHGILAVGDSILQAFDRLELIENAARMTLITEVMRRRNPLTRSRLQEIEKLFR